MRNPTRIGAVLFLLLIVLCTPTGAEDREKEKDATGIFTLGEVVVVGKREAAMPPLPMPISGPA
jgi:hypothetical protein